MLNIHSYIALTAGAIVRSISKTTKYGSGAIIGGKVAIMLKKSILQQLGSNSNNIIITGTNGKSTTTRMIATALATAKTIASNSEGANMKAGLVTAFAINKNAELAILEVDEMHVPYVSNAVSPSVIVLLNFSRDQLDRFGETNYIERTLRNLLAHHKNTVVIANCDSILATSIAYDHPKVIWVSAGGCSNNLLGESIVCPRSNGTIMQISRERKGGSWYSTRSNFKRPEPHWYFDENNIYGPNSLKLPMNLSLPGIANRGNATQAIATANFLGIECFKSLKAISNISNISGRYCYIQVGLHNVRILLAKNPASWYEALLIINANKINTVVAINGQTSDGQDLSWLWDVNFEYFSKMEIIASGERSNDLMVRLRYAGVRHTRIENIIAAINSCPPGNVEVIMNYTSFLQLNRIFQNECCSDWFNIT